MMMRPRMRPMLRMRRMSKWDDDDDNDDDDDVDDDDDDDKDGDDDVDDDSAETESQVSFLWQPNHIRPPLYPTISKPDLHN